MNTSNSSKLSQGDQVASNPLTRRSFLQTTSLAAGGAVRVALHLLFDTALMAPIRGWAARTERLLELLASQ